MLMTEVFISHSFIAQAEHLVELHLQDPILDLGERQYSSIAILDLDLDTIAAAIGFSKQALVTVVQDSESACSSAGCSVELV